MKKTFRLAFMLAAMLAAATADASADGSIKRNTYQNPVIPSSTPDPTIIKCEEDGFFYLYGTEDTRNLPIYRSRNLVDWVFVGTAFNETTRPVCVGPGTDASIWAPDMNFINGQYVLYFSIGVWGHGDKCGVGVAVADRPEGPFVDRGVVLMSQEIGVNNSIDQFFIQDNGKNYLVWGSFNGIYMIELSEDGLSVKPGAEKTKIAGSLIEASYIYKHEGYYYLFGSAGSCCDGANSTYHIVCGRSDKLEGPYKDKDGHAMLYNNVETVLKGDDFVVGPGHNAEFITDDNGDIWMPYHGYLRDNPDLNRVVFLDKVQWKDGWPYIEGGHPSRSSAAPYFKNQE